MLRIGMTIRSAKMKATTPPKLMPPFHSTAASGMLPTEHTKEITATSGPTIGPQSVASTGCPVRKDGLPERIRHPGRERARDQQPADDVEPDRGPIHHEILANRGETS